MQSPSSVWPPKTQPCLPFPQPRARSLCSSHPAPMARAGRKEPRQLAASWGLPAGRSPDKEPCSPPALPRDCFTFGFIPSYQLCRGRDLARGQEGNLAHLCWVSSAWPFPMQSVLPFFKPCHLEADFAGTLSSLARGEGFGSKRSIYPGMNNRQEDRTHRKLLIDRDVIHYQSCAVWIKPALQK